jgi:hypothetical protein
MPCQGFFGYVCHSYEDHRCKRRLVQVTTLHQSMFINSKYLLQCFFYGRGITTSFGILFQIFTDNIGEVCRELWLAVNAVVVNFVAAVKAIWPFCTRENIIMVLTTATTFTFLPAMGSAALGFVEKAVIGHLIKKL